jgi:hypothetical protein
MGLYFVPTSTCEVLFLVDNFKFILQEPGK